MQPVLLLDERTLKVQVVYIGVKHMTDSNREQQKSGRRLEGAAGAASSLMPGKRRDPNPRPDFGRLLVSLRKKAGLAQRELAEALGISRRMVAYYEGQATRPPVDLLPKLAQVLAVTVEELLGTQGPSTVKTKDSRLLRRLKAIEKLPPKEQRQLQQIIDTFLQRDRFRNGTNG